MKRRTCADRDPRRVYGFEDDFLEEGSDCCNRGPGDDLGGPLFNGNNGVEVLDMSSRTYALVWFYVLSEWFVQTAEAHS